ncbi:MAG: DNA-binding domain-containing protein [Gammaproteobacteria bacterium]
MSALRELQQRFVEQIFSDDGDLPEWIRADGLASAERLDIYRNNTLVGLTKTLRSLYPVIERLVGEDFFRYAAHRYIHEYPSRSGDLNEYGADFADFLARFEPTAGLVYLPDVARLELAYQQAANAADSAALDFAALAQVAPERYEELRFRLHPTARLLVSPYPILRIWQVNQPNYADDPSVDLNQGGVKLLLIRRALEVELEPLADGEFALLQALSEPLNFGVACERALESQADFDVTASFQRHALAGTLVDFYFL